MNTKSLRVAFAAVTGARHLRDARNGQDAAASAVIECGPSSDAAVIVVCDGCGSSGSSEVGARLGARAVLRTITARLASERDPRELTFWDEVAGDVVAYLRTVAKDLGDDLEDVVHEYFLFTIVAAVVIDGTACVWSVGDGAYAIDGVVTELGPFPNNQPPYLAYELLGTRAVTRAHVAPVRSSVVVATDGAAEMRTGDDLSIARISRDPAAFVANPDSLRRFLTKQARGEERIDWNAQRVIRTPAALQDDGAIGLIVRDEEVLS